MSEPTPTKPNQHTDSTSDHRPPKPKTRIKEIDALLQDAQQYYKNLVQTPEITRSRRHTVTYMQEFQDGIPLESPEISEISEIVKHHKPSKSTKRDRKSSNTHANHILAPPKIAFSNSDSCSNFSDELHDYSPTPQLQINQTKCDQEITTYISPQSALQLILEEDSASLPPLSSPNNETQNQSSHFTLQDLDPTIINETPLQSPKLSTESTHLTPEKTESYNPKILTIPTKNLHFSDFKSEQHRLAKQGNQPTRTNEPVRTTAWSKQISQYTENDISTLQDTIQTEKPQDLPAMQTHPPPHSTKQLSRPQHVPSSQQDSTELQKEKQFINPLLEQHSSNILETTLKHLIKDFYEHTQTEGNKLLAQLSAQLTLATEEIKEEIYQTRELLQTQHNSKRTTLIDSASQTDPTLEFPETEFQPSSPPIQKMVSTAAPNYSHQEKQPPQISQKPSTPNETLQNPWTSQAWEKRKKKNQNSKNLIEQTNLSPLPPTSTGPIIVTKPQHRQTNTSASNVKSLQQTPQQSRIQSQTQKQNHSSPIVKQAESSSFKTTTQPQNVSTQPPTEPSERNHRKVFVKLLNPKDTTDALYKYLRQLHSPVLIEELRFAGISVILTCKFRRDVPTLVTFLSSKDKITKQAKIETYQPQTKKLFITSLPLNTSSEQLTSFLAPNSKNPKTFLETTKLLKKFPNEHDGKESWILSCPIKDVDNLIKIKQQLFGFATIYFRHYRRPLRCTNCQSLNKECQVDGQCPNPTICAYCGLIHPQDKCIAKSPRCINCFFHNNEHQTNLDEYHPAYSNECFLLRRLSSAEDRKHSSTDKLITPPPLLITNPLTTFL